MNVSVIIPTYNRKNLLIRAINSVFEQTLPPSEIIIVDDHSSFDAKRYIENNCDDYLDIVRILTNDRNYGGAKSRNIGARNAKSMYVAFLDSDDYWDPTKLQKQMEIVNTHPDVGLVYCDKWIIDREGSIRESGKNLIDQNIWEYLLQGWTPPNTSTLLFRKEVFWALGGFDPRLTSCQDHDLWMRVAISDVEVKYSPERLSYFTTQTNNRVSYDYGSRLHGASDFLRKWRDEIVTSRGTMYYEWFKADYIFKVMWPIFLKGFENRDWSRIWEIYTNHFVFNPLFYARSTRFLMSRAFHGIRDRGSIAWIIH